ncbi:MAG TPA: FHA domain-containing protein [Ilumatobacteraceae bacterium]|jgi:hypothetical protein
MAMLERRGPGGSELLMLDETVGRMSIGRNADNDIVVDGDATVSRVHASVERIGPAWCVTALHTTNGTFVNGEQIFGAHKLSDQDEIRVGKTVLVLRDPTSRGGATTVPIRKAPRRTQKEQRVLIELCRPVLAGKAFTPPASRTTIAKTMYVTVGAVQQHLIHLYDKFEIYPDDEQSRRVLLANEAIQSGAVTMKDLTDPPDDH